MSETVIVHEVPTNRVGQYQVLHVIDRPIPQGTRRTVVRTIDAFDNLKVAEAVAASERDKLLARD